MYYQCKYIYMKNGNELIKYYDDLDSALKAVAYDYEIGIVPLSVVTENVRYDQQDLLLKCSEFGYL